MPPTRWEEVILGMEEMGGVRYYFLCHLNGSHVIQFLKTANIIYLVSGDLVLYHLSTLRH